MSTDVTVKPTHRRCEIRQNPTVKGKPLDWETWTEENRRFNRHIVEVGEERTMVVHSGQSLMICEVPPTEDETRAKILCEAGWTETPDGWFKAGIFSKAVPAKSAEKLQDILDELGTEGEQP